MNKIEWPKWPQYNNSTLESLEDVLQSGRWAKTGQFTGTKTKESEFSNNFAKFHNAKFCITVDHGTSALVAALEALDIGYKDEVIIPGLVWVAPANAVLTVNAIPVPVDIDLDTLCMDVDEIEKAITKHTKAIIVVHTYSRTVDMDKISILSAKHNLKVIEDCAHCIGSEWRQKKVGTLGDIGVFSMQQGKILTSGEGGALITNNRKYAERIEQSTTNSRKMIPFTHSKINDVQLIAGEKRFGTNRNLSEFQAAILIDRLNYLEKEMDTRYKNALFLDKNLKQIKGVYPMKVNKNNNFNSYYGYVFRIDEYEFGRKAMEVISELQKKLNLGDFFLHSPYKPINSIELYSPNGSYEKLWGNEISRVKLSNVNLPNSDIAYNQAVVLHHSILLSEKCNIEKIVSAVKELKRDV